MSPRLTIGLILYNAEDTVERAITSLTRQTFSNFLLRVIDDSSTDKTEHIVRNLASQDKRIVYKRNQNNVGQIRNFWIAFNNVETKYFMWAAQDDYWDENYCAYLIQTLDQCDEVGLACSYTRVFDPRNLATTKVFRPNGTMSGTRFTRVVLEHLNPCVNKYYGIYRTTVLNMYPRESCIIFDYADNLVIDFINLESKTAVIPLELFNYSEIPGKLRKSLDHHISSGFLGYFFNFNHPLYIASIYKLTRISSRSLIFALFITMIVASLFILGKIVHKFHLSTK